MTPTATSIDDQPQDLRWSARARFVHSPRASANTDLRHGSGQPLRVASPSGAPSEVTVAGAVLAAGGGTRFEHVEHKLRADFRGRPVVSWAIDAAVSAGFNQLYVITGAVDLDDLIPDGVTAVHNPSWADGQATSLIAAVDAAAADGHRSVVVGLGDQPLVPASAWRSVGAAAGTIVTATFDGERRPPVRLERSIWSELPRDGDFGASVLMKRRPELVSEIPCTGNAVDIDTLEDLRRWS